MSCHNVVQWDVSERRNWKMYGRRKFQIRLWTFLAAAASFGAVPGLSIRWYQHQPRYMLRSAFIGDCHWEGKWCVVAGKEELLYMYFLPPGASNLDIRSWNNVGDVSQATRGDIVCMPEGLYVNGERVETSEGRRVFVFADSRELRPLELTDSQLRTLTYESVDELERSDLWENVIRPQVQANSWSSARR